MSVGLHSRVDGHGDALVLMHGMFGSSRNWFTVQREQAAHWQVHALDLRNHGQSAWADTMSYTQMAGDVFAYLDAQGIDAAVLLGHSMGGKVAMTMALMQPARVRALVVVDIAPVSYAPTLQPYLQAMRALDLSTIAARKQADAQLAPAVPDTSIRGFLLQNLVANKTPEPQSASALRWRINLAAMDESLAELGQFPTRFAPPASFAGPVLVPFGAQSEYMQPDHQQAMHQWFAQASLSPIDKAGHWVHAEQPALFGAALDRFLKQLPS